MGKTDVERHISKTMHKSNAKSVKSQTTLNFQPVLCAISEKVAKLTYIGLSDLYNCWLCLGHACWSEVATVYVQNNVPLALADELFHIFSDSEIAQQYTSRQTKTVCIINGAAAPYYQQQLIANMKEGPLFTIDWWINWYWSWKN